jgi:hypothetical protein
MFILALPHQASPATLAPTRMKPGPSLHLTLSLRGPNAWLVIDHRPFAHLHYESDESAEVVEERVGGCIFRHF